MSVSALVKRLGAKFQSRRTRAVLMDAHRLTSYFGGDAFFEATKRANGRAFGDYKSEDHWRRVAEILAERSPRRKSQKG